MSGLDLKALTPAALHMLHDAVRRALAADDAAGPGNEPCKVRETPDWRRWSDELEAELADRGVIITPIDWD